MGGSRPRRGVGRGDVWRGRMRSRSRSRSRVGEGRRSSSPDGGELGGEADAESEPVEEGVEGGTWGGEEDAESEPVAGGGRAGGGRGGGGGEGLGAGVAVGMGILRDGGRRYRRRDEVERERYQDGETLRRGGERDRGGGMETDTEVRRGVHWADRWPQGRERAHKGECGQGAKRGRHWRRE